MLTEFQCPNKETVSTDECLKQCKWGDRCAPLAFLRTISKEREWKGKPSVTQLIKGTREAYLLLTEPFFLNPQDALFNTIGSAFHSHMEKEGVDAEIPLEWMGITGICDEVDGDTLWDYKFVGSFKVAQAIGLTVIREEEVATGEYYKNGNPKTRKEKEYAPVKENRDMKDWELQVNMYRLMLLNAGKRVEKMKIFACARDGGTYVAKGRGIDKNLYVIDVRKFDDVEVAKYFMSKRDALNRALASKLLPDFCTEEETWKGKKCESFCSVSHICKNK